MPLAGPLLFLEFAVRGRQALSALFDAKHKIMSDPTHPSVYDLSINVVDSYKHLGTRISFKGMYDEVAFDVDS